MDIKKYKKYVIHYKEVYKAIPISSSKSIYNRVCIKQTHKLWNILSNEKYSIRSYVDILHTYYLNTKN